MHRLRRRAVTTPLAIPAALSSGTPAAPCLFISLVDPRTEAVSNVALTAKEAAGACGLAMKPYSVTMTKPW